MDFFWVFFSNFIRWVLFLMWNSWINTRNLTKFVCMACSKFVCECTDFTLFLVGWCWCGSTVAVWLLTSPALYPKVFDFGSKGKLYWVVQPQSGVSWCVVSFLLVFYAFFYWLCSWQVVQLWSVVHLLSGVIKLWLFRLLMFWPNFRCCFVGLSSLRMLCSVCVRWAITVGGCCFDVLSREWVWVVFSMCCQKKNSEWRASDGWTRAVVDRWLGHLEWGWLQ